MLVGFRVIDVGRYRKEAVKFIREVCVLENSRVAENILDEEGIVNVFSSSITEQDLEQLPFIVEPISVPDGRVLLVNATDFHIEVSLYGRVRKLSATEYLEVSVAEVDDFTEEINQGLLKAVPDVEGSDDWVLGSGSWEDKYPWNDNKQWKDG